MPLTEEELKDRLFSIYLGSADRANNFYADQADETGLVAVYNYGVQQGIAVGLAITGTEK